MLSALISLIYAKVSLMETKIALILFGHMRTYKSCFNSLKNNLLDPLNPDVFIHTWDELDSKTRSWHSYNIKDNLTLDKDGQKRIIELYKPKSITFENQNLELYKDDGMTNGMSIQGQKFMYYSFFKANELKKEHEKENNFKYDIVIKLRPDILFKESLMSFIEQYEANRLLLAGNKIGFRSKIQNYKALDILMAAESQKMDEVANIYLVIDKYLLKQDLLHSAFIDYLFDTNHEIKLSNFDYGKKWIIKREST